MIDKIKSRVEVNNFELFNTPAQYMELYGLEFTHYNGKYGSFYRAYTDEGFKVTINQRAISWEGGLHKYYSGSNHTDFTFSEVVEAIEMLDFQFEGLFNQSQIQCLEFGFNIKKSNWQDWKIYKRRRVLDMTKGHKDYGAKFKTSQYSIKGYDKKLQKKLQDKIDVIEPLDRVEIRFEKMKYVNKDRFSDKKIMLVRDLMKRQSMDHLCSLLNRELCNVACDKMIPEGLTAKKLLAWLCISDPKAKSYMMENHREDHDKLMAIYRRIPLEKSRELMKSVIEQVLDKHTELMSNVAY